MLRVSIMRFTSRRLVAIIVLAACCALICAALTKTQEDPAFGEIDSIVKTLSEITGFSERHAVPYGRMTKRQLRQFLTKRIKRTLRPEEIHSDEIALKMFGLVPRDFDLRKSTIDLLTEQAAAFYDYDAKKLFLLQDTSLDEETTTLAHELSHALADQTFNLGRFMDESPINDDENLAHTAVVEGQASWLMIAYELKRAGQPAEPTPAALKSITDSSDAGMDDFPVLKNSPLYIQQSLLFPYTQGTEFFQSVWKKMGKRAFAEVFTQPPVDTAQVIHPDRYFARVSPPKPQLEPLGLAAAKEMSEGVLGEFDHQMLLKQYDGDAIASEISPHLSSAEFKIFAVGKNRIPVLHYVSSWDSPSFAAKFFVAYENVLQRKWRHCQPSIQNPTTFGGMGDSGLFVTRLAGTTVTSVEGIADQREWERLVGGAQLNTAATLH